MASESLWKEAFSQVLYQFEIPELLTEQEEAIRSFLNGFNVFVNLPTGFGKSLIFQCLPIVSDVLNTKPRGSSLIVVVSPLISLMKDQVTSLLNIGIPAIMIGEDTTDGEVIQQVLNGNFNVVFFSPECLLSSTWRDILTDESFKEKLIGVAIDEAHCITQWGMCGDKKIPFHKYYGQLGELCSLIPEGCKILILTATATAATKQQILGSLNMTRQNVKFIEHSPDRANLFYSTVYLDKNQPLERAFGAVIKELETIGKETPRTIIYCQTRKQCSLLFSMFEMFLGKSFYNGIKRPQNRLVEMYHASSPLSVKEHVMQNMADCDGHIRVLISTVAFGMGVNCKTVRRIIHFGPSKSIEMYIPECGRAGRDGEASICILLHNGLLSAYCDNDIKNYVQAELCLRKLLMVHFSQTESKPRTEDSTFLHNCCKNCHSKCDCGGCPQLWNPDINEEDSPKSMYFQKYQHKQLTRVVSDKDKIVLHEKLCKFKQSLQSNIDVRSLVSCPNVILEFNEFHISQVMQHCHSLFTLEDVVQLVEIWRSQYAIGILKIISDTFQDVNIDFSSFEELHAEIDETVFSEWDNIRDDSTLLQFFDTRELEEIESSMDTDDTT